MQISIKLNLIIVHNKLSDSNNIIIRIFSYNIKFSPNKTDLSECVNNKDNNVNIENNTIYNLFAVNIIKILV